MRTTLEKFGNSPGVLIPVSWLAECGITDEIDIHLEGTKIVIEAVRPPRMGWFDGHRAEDDDDAWETLSPAADADEWEW